MNIDFSVLRKLLAQDHQIFVRDPEQNAADYGKRI